MASSMLYTSGTQSGLWGGRQGQKPTQTNSFHPEKHFIGSLAEKAQESSLQGPALPSFAWPLGTDCRLGTVQGAGDPP